jgi:hypothetical protein
MKQSVKKCEAEQLNLVLAFKKCGLSKKKFCEQQNLSLSTFRIWYYRLIDHPALKSFDEKPSQVFHQRGFAHLVIAESANPRSEAAARETTSESSHSSSLSSLSLRFLGCEILIPQDFDARTLRRLLSSLQEFSSLELREKSHDY